MTSTSNLSFHALWEIFYMDSLILGFATAKVSQTWFCYIKLGDSYKENHKVGKEIRVQDTTILLYALWSYVQDLDKYLHYNGSSV